MAATTKPRRRIGGGISASDLQLNRKKILDGLRARRAEIEEAVRTRVYAISDPPEMGDPEYAEGLRAAVSAALDFGLLGIEQGDEQQPPPVPATLLAQARIAARSGVSLDTVLRRYLGGYTLLGDYLVEEAEAQGLRGVSLKRLLRSQASIFDRLLTAVSEEYGREEQSPATGEGRRVEWVRQLLAGERLEAPALAYELAGWHLGVIAIGYGATNSLERVAQMMDRRLLAIPHGEGAIWAWFGGRRRLRSEELQSCVAAVGIDGAVAIGEPGKGIVGWRQTHRQASAAQRLLVRSGQPYVRYRDVALLASIIGDDLLTASLRQLYLQPLTEERDEGEVARETLRAYFAAERNVSSAAISLGVSRQAVGRRLRAIEERLGQPLGECAQALEVALSLDQHDAGERHTGRLSISEALSLCPPR